MLDRIVRYLRSNGISIRLSSHPAPEAIPAVAHRSPQGGVFVRTCIVMAGGQPIICCMAKEAAVSVPRLQATLGVPVLEADSRDLPAPYTGAEGPIPPFGGELGAVVLMDESLLRASAVSFAAFSATDIFDLPLDEFLRLERPRIEAFVTAGELHE